MYAYNDIKHVHLELSSRCTATCPECPRNFYGVNGLIDDYPVHAMTLAEAQNIFSVPFLKQLTKISINGNFGDFNTVPDGLDIVRFFKQSNPGLKINISTNGSAKKDNFWSELGKLRTEVVFCLDGLEDTHRLYRRNTDWNLIISNAKEFIAAGGKATWKMLSFKHNQHQIDACRNLSLALGFIDFWLCPGRDGLPVFNHKKEYLYDIGDHDQPREFNELFAVCQNSKQNIDLYRPEFERRVIECQVQKDKSIYITATGEVYPCCWTGFYPRTKSWPDNLSIKALLDDVDNNANTVGIEQAMQWFTKVSDGWPTENQLYACSENCGVRA